MQKTEPTERYSDLFARLNLLLAPAAATIIEDKRNRVVVQTENGTAGLLVLSDNNYPGWSAFVDGEPANIFQTNLTMRAVAVPAGRHLVSFVFAPPTLRIAAYASLIGAVLTLICLVFPFGKRNRISRPE
jgi:uncharacterized membrane protein YfhO